MNYTLSELKILVNNISKKVKLGTIIYLKGELGTGKTAIVKFLIENLFKNSKKKKSYSYKPYI